MNNRTPKTTKTEPTAAQTYAARQNDIARLMDVLQMELDKHAEGAKADPRNWGFAGSIGKVRGDLIDAVAFISGKDREDVVAFLDE